MQEDSHEVNEKDEDQKISIQEDIFEEKDEVSERNQRETKQISSRSESFFGVEGSFSRCELRSSLTDLSVVSKEECVLPATDTEKSSRVGTVSEKRSGRRFRHRLISLKKRCCKFFKS